MTCVIVVGTQWGDEGKGKVIDLLTSRAQHVVRAQGGNNAGHTIMIGPEEYKLHLIPSGILHDHTQCYLGAGMVIDPEVVLQEKEDLESRGINTQGRLWISPGAHVILPHHKVLDKLLEQHKGSQAVGTTGKGIGPCYADKAHRLGIRIGELVRPEILRPLMDNLMALGNDLITFYGGEPLDSEAVYAQYCDYGQRLESLVTQVEVTIANAVASGDNVLLEGAQGTFLDITSGTYPFVTSSNTTAGGICIGAGIGPSAINHTIGIVKAYTTRVGHGPFPTECAADSPIADPEAAREYGVTTGRVRRQGWFDAVMVKRAVHLNGLNSMALTKLDILDELSSIKICIAYELDGRQLDYLPTVNADLERVKPIYEEMEGWMTPTTTATHIEDLPANARAYIKRIEQLCGIPASILSVGPERERTITITDLFEPQKCKD